MDGKKYRNNLVEVVGQNSGNEADLIANSDSEDYWLLEAIKEDTSYKLRADLDDKNNKYLTEGLEISRDFTLDLNGHHLMIKLSPLDGNQSNAIKIANGAVLTIIDTSSTASGKLTVINEANEPTQNNGAAINITEGKLIIESGTVIARGGNGAAGIGGGSEGDGGHVTIEAGMVIAEGGSNAAGIGGGIGSKNSGILIINGGSVKTNNLSADKASKAMNKNGTPLKLVTLRLIKTNGVNENAISNIPLSNSQIKFYADNAYNYIYNTQGVKSDINGNLYFWLPADIDSFSIAVTADGRKHSNNNVRADETNDEPAYLLDEESLLRIAVANGGEYQLKVDFDGADGNEPYLKEVLEIDKDFTLDLAGHHLKIKIDSSESQADGIKITNDAVLIIKDSSNPSTGKLTVSVSNYLGAGINLSSGGELVIESGTVDVTSLNAAAIGGIMYGKGGKVTIKGGTVTAIGGVGSAGIGGGFHGDGGTVIIEGGTVTAAGGPESAGIGGGFLGDGGTVIIKGGTVTATGKGGAAGIGGGTGGKGAAVIIEGGNVIAAGGSQIAGIGGGSGCVDNGSLIISGGSVQMQYMLNTTAVVPRNKYNTVLYPVTLTLKWKDRAADKLLDDAGHIIKTAEGTYGYGTKDVKTDAKGNVYFWLPAGNGSVI